MQKEIIEKVSKKLRGCEKEGTRKRKWRNVRKKEGSEESIEKIKGEAKWNIYSDIKLFCMNTES